jgi:hypothetical protein
LVRTLQEDTVELTLPLPPNSSPISVWRHHLNKTQPQCFPLGLACTFLPHVDAPLGSIQEFPYAPYHQIGLLQQQQQQQLCGAVRRIQGKLCHWQQQKSGLVHSLLM